jgi:hypothetical protein
VDFEFQLTAVQHHPAFIVTPMRGVVPANGKVDVMVTFAPTEFSTAVMKLQLELTQFNSSPLLCTFSGSSLPGLDIESVGSRVQLKIPPASRLTKTISLPPLTDTLPSGEGSKEKKSGRTKKQRRGVKSTKATSPGEEMLIVNTPAAVSKILTQKSSHHNVTSPEEWSAATSAARNRQKRETEFLRRVQQAAKDERANRLRWVTQLGDAPPGDSLMEGILRERNAATDLHYCHKPVAGSEPSHTHTQCLYRRTRRIVNEHPSVVPKFDLYSNNLWQKRQRARLAFIRAARRVLIQVRVLRRLQKSQEVVERMKSGVETEEELYTK